MGGIPPELESILGALTALKPGQQIILQCASYEGARKVQRWFSFTRAKAQKSAFAFEEDVKTKEEKEKMGVRKKAIRYQTPSLTYDEADPWRGIITFICTPEGDSIAYGSPRIRQFRHLLNCVCFRRPTPYVIGPITDTDGNPVGRSEGASPALSATSANSAVKQKKSPRKKKSA